MSIQTFRVTGILSIKVYENDILYPIGQNFTSILMKLSKGRDVNRTLKFNRDIDILYLKYRMKTDV